MLHRNIDTNGLVNGSIRSVTAMTSNSITVKFDHITEPYSAERVKNKLSKAVSADLGIYGYNS